WSMQPNPGNVMDAIVRMRSAFYSQSGINFLGFSAPGKTDGKGDPFVDQQIEKAMVEFDREKRVAIGYDLQRYLAQRMYDVKWPGTASGFALAWPNVRNYNIYRSVGTYARPDPYFYWLDDTQPPMKK